MLIIYLMSTSNLMD